MLCNTCFGQQNSPFQTQVAILSTMIASIHLVEPNHESGDNNSLESTGKTFGHGTIRVEKGLHRHIRSLSWDRLI